MTVPVTFERDIVHFQKNHDHDSKIASWLVGCIKLRFRKLNSLLYKAQTGAYTMKSMPQQRLTSTPRMKSNLVL
jgi:hypothetical protein